MPKNAEDVLLACDITPACDGVLHPNVDERAPGYAHFAARCTQCGGVHNYGLHPLQRRQGETCEEYQDTGGNWHPLPPPEPLFRGKGAAREVSRDGGKTWEPAE